MEVAIMALLADEGVWDGVGSDNSKKARCSILILF